MKSKRENDEYWHQLYLDGWIEIDFETGFIYSNLKQRRFKNNNKKRRIGIRENRKIENNYVRVHAKGYATYAHRLIWIAKNGFIPELYEINHINGIKYDNRLCNLEMVTESENQLHRYRVLGKKNRTPCGENHYNSKLTWKNILDMRWLSEEGISITQIAKEFEMSYASTKDIIENVTWKKESECIKQ